MATYKQLSIGSKGDDVKDLQKALGFTGKDVDGIFGEQTKKAVMNYQRKKGLAVDGIAGDKTLGALYGTKKTQTSNNAASVQSDAVKQARTLLAQYKTDRDDAWEQYINRDDFSYDLNSDALYQQYADQYARMGNMAMADTMGQAAALTGGYGNSYAQSAGQQTYQGYLQQLNDVVPELYGMAYDQYNQEGQDLLNQYAHYSDLYSQGYGEYQDALSQQKDAAANLVTLIAMGYKPTNAELTEAGMSRDQADVYAKYYQSVSEGGGEGHGKGWDNGDYETSVVKKAQLFVGADDDGLWGPNSAAKAKKKGYNSLAEVVAAMNYSSGYFQKFNEHRFDEPGELFSDNELKGFRRTLAQTRGKEGRCQLIDDAINEGKISGKTASTLLRPYGISEEEFKAIMGYQ